LRAAAKHNHSSCTLQVWLSRSSQIPADLRRSLKMAAAAVATVDMITRYFVMARSETSYEHEFKDKLVEERLPFAWMPPRPTSRTIGEALSAMAETGPRRKRARLVEEEEETKLPLHAEFFLMEFVHIDPRFPEDQSHAMMLGGGAPVDAYQCIIKQFVFFGGCAYRTYGLIAS
jgi:hypothetical protein